MLTLGKAERDFMEAAHCNEDEDEEDELLRQAIAEENDEEELLRQAIALSLEACK